MDIIVTTPEKLAEVIRAAVAEATNAMPAKMWDAKETAAFLGVSVSTIYTLAANGEIPCRKIGDRYVFHPAQVDAWAKK